LFIGTYALRVAATPSFLILETGVLRAEILRVSELLATKLVENEFAAYFDLYVLMASGEALSPRGFTIASYALCGFSNLGSLQLVFRLAHSRHLRLRAHVSLHVSARAL
jgi:nucleoside permease NupC